MGREEHHKHHWCLWGLLAVSGPHWVAPLMVCVFSWSTLLRLQVALQGNCLKQALGCMHFPGLSRSGSGSRVLYKGADSLGLRFMPFPGLHHPGNQVLGERTLPRSGGESYHLPHPSCSVSWVRNGSAVSGMLCVSSGVLISGCDPPGECPPSRIPGRLD